MYITQRIIYLCILVLLLNPLYADSQLNDFISDKDINLYWDPIIQRGILWQGNNFLSFHSEFPIASKNFQEFLAIQPLYLKNGILHIPSATEEIILNSLGALATEELRSISTIYIDPGHGGKDPGAVGKLASGELIYEKDIVLEVAQNLAVQLRQALPEKKILLSRDSDVYLSLEERTTMANELAGDSNEKVVFISLHVNAAINDNARGFEVWYLPPEYRRQVINASKISSEDEEVLPILNTLLEEEYTLESVILARYVEENALEQIAKYSISRGLKEMDWYVVRRAFMPSVLIELGFITHQEEVELLNDPSYLKTLTNGIFNGIIQFVEDFENVSTQ